MANMLNKVSKLTGIEREWGKGTCPLYLRKQNAKHISSIC